MVSRQLIINHSAAETRIALLEKNNLTELFIETADDRGILGNIYKGKVMRVLPGMQAAFVDIGLERTAFLYGGDALSEDDLKAKIKFIESQLIDGDDDSVEFKAKTKTPIEKILKQGQEILVQVAKEPLGTKGARVTMNLTLPGRYLVYLPQFYHISISKKIEDETEKDRLRELVKEIKDSKDGVIIRTAAMGANAMHFTKDLEYLQRTWKKIEQRGNTAKAPSLIHDDLDLIEKVTRDLYSEDIDRIIIDCAETSQRLKNFLRATIPGASRKLELYQADTPIFDSFGLENEIEKAMHKRVDLPSGGYLIIEQTEALTSVDVNTGSYVGHTNADETIFKTNLEAIPAIVTQLRLRNIGGIIILDLIDMEKEEHKEKIFTTLNDELKLDRARTTAYPINQLGLLMMTRKRTRDSLERQLMESCNTCGGRGRVKNTVTLAHDLLREIVRYAKRSGEKKIKVRAEDDIINWILEVEEDWLSRISWECQIDVEFAATSVRSSKEPPFEVF